MARTVLVRDTEGSPQQAFVVAPSDFYAQDTDPGAVGAGSVWKDTSETPQASWWERNTANDAWDPVFHPYVFSVDSTAAAALDVQTEDGIADVSVFAEAGGTGEAIAQLSAISTSGNATAKSLATSGDGTADAHSAATADAGSADAHIAATSGGAGDADTTATSTTVTGDATSGIKADRGGTVASVLVDSTGANARVRAVASDITATASDALVLAGTGSAALGSDGPVTIEALAALALLGATVEIGTGSVTLNIPTTDPGGGALWCDPADGFTVKVSQT